MASDVTGYAVRFLTDAIDRAEYGWMEDPSDTVATGTLRERYIFRTKNGAKREARKLRRLNPGCRYAVVTVRNRPSVPDTTLLDRALELMREERNTDNRYSNNGSTSAGLYVTADDVMIEIVENVREEALAGR